jgi:hypothetical protein
LVCVGPVSGAMYLLPPVCFHGKERGKLICMFRSGVTHALVGIELKFVVCVCVFFLSLGSAHGAGVSVPK